ncbi:nitrate- and nitrite sensing domain-containing protein [Streptomyces sp. NPDC058579]|uniref:sensor histidine kinase n=1 Tax=Streptomyces sp. NPDC058579 TaxID=3346548 RepID=UPI003657DA68
MLSPQNWKISTRMAVILLLPTLLILGLSASTVRASLERGDQMAVTEQSSELVLAATQLAHALGNERDFAALQEKSKTDMAPYRTATDKVLATYHQRSAVKLDRPGFAERLADTEAALQGLAQLRSKAYSKTLDAVATDLAYANIITPLLGLAIEVGRGDGATAADTWALSSLSMGKASISSQRALLNAGFSRGKVAKQESAEAASHAGLQKVVFREFLVTAEKQDVQAFQRAFDAAYIAAMVSKAGSAKPSELDASVLKDWNTSATRVIDDLHRIETRIALRISEKAANERYEVQKDAWWNGGIVVVSLLLTLLLAAWIVQVTVRQLTRLRRTALRAARQELPELVASLAGGGTDTGPHRSVALDLGTRDEIGDVSRAFEQVFAEALKQTVEQAALRGSVNGMLASMARRSQILVHRQLGVISDLERTEADPARLAELFHVDHLATRMRRHGENLLVLAGENPGRVHQTPAPLVDVLRAAVSEVEQFARIQVIRGVEVWVAAPVVHDLTHLLAELMENAAQYSAPSTQVVVACRATADGGVLIDIEDSGVGIAPELVVKLNAALAQTGILDASATRRMGLYVVGRLAAAHHIKVQLSVMGKGTTASVVVPGPALTAVRPPQGPATFVKPSPDAEKAVPHRPAIPAQARPPAQIPAPAPAQQSELRPGALPSRTPRATLRGPDLLAATNGEEQRTDPAQARRRASGFSAGTRRARQDHHSDADTSTDSKDGPTP